MKLKDQVCSSELSKKLKELGVKQESLFSWCVPENNFYRDEYKIYNDVLNLYINKAQTPYRIIDNDSDYLNIGGCDCCTEYSKTKESYSAFTASELLEMLPDYIEETKVLML